MSAESIEFRRATPQDVSAMTLVLMRANAQRDGEPLPVMAGDSQAAHMYERISNPNRWAYVAADGERVVGLALGYPGNGTEDPTMDAQAEYLSHLMIEPECWGNRVASRLIDIVASEARSAGKSQLTLWTRREDNAHARGVYEHKGFSSTGLVRDSQYGQQVHYQLDL